MTSLLIPIAGLPGPLPEGAPRCYWTPVSEVMIPALDLSPPPTDAAGWPTRIDGLDVAAAMLARAMAGEPILAPALADIDPTDPDAARLAMVAIFKAKPWAKAR